MYMDGYISLLVGTAAALIGMYAFGLWQQYRRHKHKDRH